MLKPIELNLNALRRVHFECNCIHTPLASPPTQLSGISYQNLLLQIYVWVLLFSTATNLMGKSFHFESFLFSQSQKPLFHDFLADDYWNRVSDTLNVSYSEGTNVLCQWPPLYVRVVGSTSTALLFRHFPYKNTVHDILKIHDSYTKK